MHWVDKQEDFDSAVVDGKCVAFESQETAMLEFLDGIGHAPILRIEMPILSAKQLYFSKRELYRACTFNEIQHLHDGRFSEIAMGLHEMRELAQRLNDLDMKHQIITD
ncbi:hypothetical protein ACO0LG_29065 [Undibacterium sp. Ji42W]